MKIGFVNSSTTIVFKETDDKEQNIMKKQSVNLGRLNFLFNFAC